MKINYNKGNLFTTRCDVIAHGCNMQGVMGSGVAAQVRKLYPDAYDEYHKLFLEKKLELGMVQFVQIPNQKIIANCITQEFYGRDKDKIYMDYTALRKCMWGLNKTCYERKFSLAMPMIGAGLGGGDWKIIEEIIEKEFLDVVPNIYVL